MTKPQLKMNWPLTRLDQPPEIEIADGYSIRQCVPDDEAAYFKLMHDCGWPDWGQDRMDYCKSRLLPFGWFLVVESANDVPVASAMSLHNYSQKAPQSGTLGWVACDPNHRGKRLGRAVVAAVTCRLLAGAYQDIELYTEHFRLPALHVYLDLGYVPYLYSEAVREVWRDVCGELGWPFTPDQWPAGDNAFPSS